MKLDFIYDPSLVLYLPLWEKDGGSFMDKSAYGHLATVTGAIWGLQGRTFDGSDDIITLPASSALQMGTGDWSAELWFNTDSGGVQYPGLIVFDNDGIMLPLYGQPGLLQDGDVVSGSGGTWGTDSWNHCVATRSGTTYKMYKNGIDVTSAYTNAGWGLAGIYTIGQGYTTDRFKGRIGEVRIYNRVLSDLELQHNYLRTKWRYV